VVLRTFSQSSLTVPASAVRFNSNVRPHSHTPVKLHPALAKRQTSVYVAAGPVAAGLAYSFYPRLCPTNSNACFRFYTAHLSILITCVALLVLYAWGLVYARRHQGDWRKTPLTATTAGGSFYFLGRALLAGAVGWLVGAIARAF
jgi:hypothetical protein